MALIHSEKKEIYDMIVSAVKRLKEQPYDVCIKIEHDAQMTKESNYKEFLASVIGHIQDECCKDTLVASRHSYFTIIYRRENNQEFNLNDYDSFTNENIEWR